ncbi:MAG: FkbM family methyltransferase [Candidatus Shapirobacteria bacterium]|nr:FkbM family methyltransferase [Candidatus Shapirobacteria bacterium]
MKDLKLVEIKVHGYECKFWYLKDDKFIGQRVALGKYEPYVTKLMLDQINEGDVVVDVGANIGYDTVLFAKKVGKNGKVYSIEPDPTNFAILEKNIKSNGLKNVVVVKAALGNANKKMKFFESEENFGDHRVWGESKMTMEIFCRRLDDLLKDLGGKEVNFIKIDTQGWEPAVIEGAKETIQNYKPTIFFEYWPWAYHQAKLGGKEMTEFLRQNYGSTNYIDEYIQIYLGKNQNWLDRNFKVNEKNNYGNLWVKKDKDFGFYWGQLQDFWLKKWVKRMLSRPLT